MTKPALNIDETARLAANHPGTATLAASWCALLIELIIRFRRTVPLKWELIVLKGLSFEKLHYCFREPSAEREVPKSDLPEVRIRLFGLFYLVHLVII